MRAPLPHNPKLKFVEQNHLNKVLAFLQAAIGEGADRLDHRNLVARSITTNTRALVKKRAERIADVGAGDAVLQHRGIMSKGLPFDFDFVGMHVVVTRNSIASFGIGKDDFHWISCFEDGWKR